jgi:hypothetical protein
MLQVAAHRAYDGEEQRCARIDLAVLNPLDLRFMRVQARAQFGACEALGFAQGLDVGAGGMASSSSCISPPHVPRRRPRRSRST